MSPRLDSWWSGSFPLPGREFHPLETPGLSWRTKVGSQIKIDDFGLRLHDPLDHTVDRFMCRSLRSISVRSRLEVGLENRLQDELKDSLDHAVPDRRYGENSNFRSSVFRYLLLPDWHGPIRVGDQFAPDLLKKT